MRGPRSPADEGDPCVAGAVAIWFLTIAVGFSPRRNLPEHRRDSCCSRWLADLPRRGASARSGPPGGPRGRSRSSPGRSPRRPVRLAPQLRPSRPTRSCADHRVRPAAEWPASRSGASSSPSAPPISAPVRPVRRFTLTPSSVHLQDRALLPRTSQGPMRSALAAVVDDLCPRPRRLREEDLRAARPGRPVGAPLPRPPPGERPARLATPSSSARSARSPAPRRRSASPPATASSSRSRR